MTSEPLCALCAIPKSSHQDAQESLPNSDFWHFFSHKFITYDELMRRIANSVFAPRQFTMLQVGNDYYSYYVN